MFVVIIINGTPLIPLASRPVTFISICISNLSSAVFFHTHIFNYFLVVDDAQAATKKLLSSSTQHDEISILRGSSTIAERKGEPSRRQGPKYNSITRYEPFCPLVGPRRADPFFSTRLSRTWLFFLHLRGPQTIFPHNKSPQQIFKNLFLGPFIAAIKDDYVIF